MTQPIRVAIVGGGCGAITTAYELSRPEHAGRFEVTVYQEGWRLGGKGASGRGAAGRIEEHGLHIWLGYYDNSFRMMRDCYAELLAQGDANFGAFADAFTPEPRIGLFAETEQGGWQRWAARFPSRPGLPGDPLPPGQDYSLATYLRGAIEMVQTMLLDFGVVRDARGGPEAGGGDPVGAIQLLLGRGIFGGAVFVCQGLALLGAALALLPSAWNGAVLELVDRLIRETRRIVEANLLAPDQHRHLWELVELVLVATVGMIRAGLLTDSRGLDTLDDLDCRQWLLANGASQRAVDSPFIRGLYDLSLAYEDGDDARPSMAAGSALRGWLRMFFGYRGAIMWRMRAGMGDVMFAPLYRLLANRGVRFEFFHRLTNVGLAPGGPIGPEERSHVTSLSFDVQAEVQGGAGYSPLVSVAGRPCWPAEPDFSQLKGGARLARTGVDFESHWDRRHAGTKRLEVGRDFDFCVLAVSIGAIPHCCPELLARDSRWRAMVAIVKTVATQACQIWLSEDVDRLGWAGPPYIVAGSARPFDTWCDMAHVIPEENWTKRPATAVYFCSVLPEPPPGADKDAPAYPTDRRDEVRENAVRLLSDRLRPVWPAAYDANGRFRWPLLAVPSGAEVRGPEGFATQYWRANVNPTERYVQSLPGSSRYRLSPLDMTYDNFTIAGDWTACGLNTGCTESAVISGRLAAHALSGLPRLESITGYDHP